MVKEFDANYKEWLRSLKNEYRKSQIKAAVKVNAELIRFYYFLGKGISQRHFESVYGSGFYQRLSVDLRKEIPDASGFSVTNLHYVYWFYERYKLLDGEFTAENGVFTFLQQVAVESCATIEKAHKKLQSENLQQVAVELVSLPWGHHQVILGKVKTIEESLFYVHEAFANGWSRAVLLNFIKSGLYARQGQAITNFAQTLPEIDSDLAQQLTRDPYDFNFISIETKYKERKLKDTLINGLESFLLELGNGFAFLGKEVRIMVGDKEKFMDMLFYNMNLHCYVVVEVKVEDLDSDNLGQLGLYVTAVNHQMRKEGDAPTIGLLIVSDKNNLFAKYALEMMSVPIGIAEYRLTNFLPDNLQSELPSVKDIEEGLK